MTGKIKKFLESIESNLYLAERIRDSKSIEEVFEISKNYLDGMTFDEFSQAMLEIANELSNEIRSLDEDELEAISGGLDFKTFEKYINKTKHLSAAAVLSASIILGTGSQAFAMKEPSSVSTGETKSSVLGSMLFEAGKGAVLPIVTDMYYKLKNLCFQKVKQQYLNVYNNIHGFKDRNEIYQSLLKMSEKIKGQEEAQEQIISACNNVLDDLDKKSKSGHVLYLTGASGVGKTESAKEIAKAFLKDNTKPFIVSRDNVNPKGDLKDQLFREDENYQGQDSNKKSKKVESLAEYILNNPKCVVIVDEYDKLCTPTPKTQYTSSQPNDSFDEILRSIMNFGKATTTNGREIPCDGVIFILTSNEHIDCFSKDKEAIKRVQQKIDEGVIDEPDGTTYRQHSQSLLNRIRVAEFQQIPESAYQEIADNFMKEISEEYRTNKHYKCNIKLDSNVIKNMGRAAANNPTQGARSIKVDMKQKFSGAIGKLKTKYNSNEISIADKTFVLSYDDKSGEFSFAEQLEDKSLQKFLQDVDSNYEETGGHLPVDEFYMELSENIEKDIIDRGKYNDSITIKEFINKLALKAYDKYPKRITGCTFKLSINKDSGYLELTNEKTNEKITLSEDEMNSDFKLDWNESLGKYELKMAPNNKTQKEKLGKAVKSSSDIKIDESAQNSELTNSPLERQEVKELSLNNQQEDLKVNTQSGSNIKIAEENKEGKIDSRESSEVNIQNSSTEIVEEKKAKDKKEKRVFQKVKIENLENEDLEKE